MTEIIIQPRKSSETAAAFKAAIFPTLINHQDEWLSWDGAAYQPIEDATVQARISEFLNTAKVQVFKDGSGQVSLLPFFPKTKDIAEVHKMLGHLCHVPLNTMSPPAWLKGTPADYRRLDPRNLISLKNGLLDITTRKLYSATPFFFSRTAIPIDYDKRAPAPMQWLAFLDQVTAGKNDAGEPVARPALVTLIREMMGYLLSSDTSKQKVFHLCGQPRSGKGTILRVLTSMIGQRNTVAPTIQSLNNDFGPQSFIGKSLATFTDMSTDNRTHLSAAASHINAISGEDFQTIQRKHKSSWDGYLPTRFLLVSNAVPNFGAHTAALAERLLIIPFENSFASRADTELTGKLLAELPGILNWALDGLDDLNIIGKFIEPADCVKLKERLVMRSDPVHGFVAEYCTVGPCAGIDKNTLYHRFVEYCEEVHVRPKSRDDFTETLTDLYPIVLTSKRPFAKGSTRKVPCYRNIALNDVEAAKVFKIDAEMIDRFECTIGQALIRDSAGWPIKRADVEREFQ
jgi:putative DNA primase/helicase